MADDDLRTPEQRACRHKWSLTLGTHVKHEGNVTRFSVCSICGTRRWLDGKRQWRYAIPAVRPF